MKFQNEYLFFSYFNFLCDLFESLKSLKLKKDKNNNFDQIIEKIEKEKNEISKIKATESELSSYSNFLNELTGVINSSEKVPQKIEQLLSILNEIMEKIVYFQEVFNNNGCDFLKDIISKVGEATNFTTTVVAKGRSTKR